MVTIDPMPKILKFHDNSPYPAIVFTTLALAIGILAAVLVGDQFVIFESETPSATAAVDELSP